MLRSSLLTKVQNTISFSLESSLCEPWLEADRLARASAVAVILDLGQETLLLTERSFQVGSHKGQISFPGGRADKSDLTPLDTAIRECVEELGIDATSLRFLGMGQRARAIDGSPVFPVMFETDGVGALKPSPEEVARVFFPSLHEFLREKAGTQDLEFFQMKRKTFLFHALGEGNPVVWGLTAHILHAFDFSVR